VLGELLQAGSDILRELFDMEAQGEMSECVHHTMNREEKRALVAAARAEAFTDVVGILEGFAEKKK
jgi:hypothetical protein